jgi:hypothetical protein
MRDDVDEPTSNKHLEGICCGCSANVMFCGSQGDTVSRFLTPHAQRDHRRHRGGDAQKTQECCCFGRHVHGPVRWVHQYRHQSILLGCPLMLHLCSYERLPVGRPSVDRSLYRALEEGHDPADRPTMGSMWCHRKVRTLN